MMAKRMIEDRSFMEGMLREAKTGSLSTVDSEGQPYITPLTFYYEDNAIYFHCALKGRKLDNIAYQPKICFSVYTLDKLLDGEKACDGSARYRSVLCFGTAEVMKDSEEKAELLARYSSKYGNREYETPEMDIVRRTGFVKIKIESMTAKAYQD